MTSPDNKNKENWPSAAQGYSQLPKDKKGSAVLGNKRLTASVSAILLFLLLVELATVPSLRPVLSLHSFVGVLLVGPLVLKLVSTGYKFLRYYTRAPAFVREGPPRLWLRLLAPLLVATTLVMFGSGLGLLLTTPTQAGPLRPIHIISFVVWLPMLMLHLFAHLGQVPALIRDDWRELPDPVSVSALPGNKLRLVVNLGALLVGGSAALLTLPLVAPWLTLFETSESGPGPFIVGLVASLLALLASRPLRKGGT